MKTDYLHHHFEIKLHSTIHASCILIDLLRSFGLNVDQWGVGGSNGRIEKTAR